MVGVPFLSSANLSAGDDILVVNSTLLKFMGFIFHESVVDLMIFAWIVNWQIEPLIFMIVF